jgi:methylenetetrahydrofolate dehydrogenase (NADP+)/methenyltetrahydrofolate cyclohydrolase
MRVLSGQELAAHIRTEASQKAAQLAAAGQQPHLVIVTATVDEASGWYVRSIANGAAALGIACTVEDLGAGAPASRIRAALATHSADDAVSGLILQAPLPAGLSHADLASGIDPVKDIDGANPLSLGRLSAGLPAFAPATAAAVLALLDHYDIAVEGAHAVIVGRSTVVGKPLAQLLLDRNATVTICHSRTPDLAAHTRTAEVLVVAAGRAGLIGSAHVRPGATVVDVGTNPRADGSLVGDVDAEAVAEQAGALTPVPGGIGPVTTALLLRNAVTAAAAARRID